MTDDLTDKHREAQRLLEEAKEDFSKAHEKGMESFKSLTGQERADQLSEAIKQEQQAIEKSSKGIELQREAIAEQQEKLEE